MNANRFKKHRDVFIGRLHDEAFTLGLSWTWRPTEGRSLVDIIRTGNVHSVHHLILTEWISTWQIVPVVSEL